MHKTDAGSNIRNRENVDFTKFFVLDTFEKEKRKHYFQKYLIYPNFSMKNPYFLWRGCFQFGKCEAFFI